MRARSLLLAVLLSIPCLAVLLVGTYNRIEPRFLGIPFFYWYQIMWAPLSAVFLGAAYLITAAERR